MSAAPDIWLSAQEIADANLPGMPGTWFGVATLAERLGWGEQARQRAGQGGGLEYPVSLFPVPAQRVLLADAQGVDTADKLGAVEAVHAYRAAGRGKGRAVREAARAHEVSESSLWRWLASVEGLDAEARALRLSQSPEARRVAFEAECESTNKAAAREAGLAALVALPETARAVAEARAAILKAVAGLAASTGLPMTMARKVFDEAWSAHDDDEFGLGAEVRGHVTRVSAASLKRWQAMFDKGGLAALAPKHGAARKGTGTIDQDDAIRLLIEGMLLHDPGCSAKLVMRAIRARHGDRDIPGYRTLQRWMADWKARNNALLQMASSPDGYRSKVRLVSGNASEHVVRLNQLWEMDSTPNDVILSDGKRHALIGCIDVYTRRVKLFVGRTSNSAGVAACLRKAMLDWGVPELLKTDNGSDYASKHMETVALALEIEQDFCPPFQPQKKPHIERFFGTFTRDLVELLDGFIGHNVDQRKRIEDRKAFAKRLTDRSAEPVEIRLTAEELQTFCDKWCADIYEQEEHGTLNCSPFERAQSWTGPVRRIRDERALDVLLMPVPGDGGTRNVTKYGIRIENAKFVAPELQRLVGQRVQVRLDEADWGRILVLAEDGAFICWALCPERSGVSRAEFSGWFNAKSREVEKDMRAEASEKKRAIKRSALASDILGKAAEARGAVLSFPNRAETDHTTPALQAGAAAAETRGKPRLVEKREDVSAAEIAQLDDARPVRREEDDRSRFLRWEGIAARVGKGETVEDTASRFWRSFQATPDYAAMVDLIEEFGRAAVLGEAAVEDSAG